MNFLSVVDTVLNSEIVDSVVEEIVDSVVEEIVDPVVEECVDPVVDQVVEECVDPEIYTPSTEEMEETSDKESSVQNLNRPIVGAISTQKMAHGRMVFNGICTQCVRCKLKLTDAISVERGMGPECSSKGYAEDPKDPDEMGAMIELSAYPELVQFLTDHYKPHGVRGLMNGLVRVAALNRKDPVHAACADAIELLGYRKLASALRDSLHIMSVKESEAHPGCYIVWVKKSEWSRSWSTDCYNKIPSVFFSKEEKGFVVQKKHKGILWGLMKLHYSGECAKTPNGTVKIP